MVDELSQGERRALEAWTPMAPPVDFAQRVASARGWSKRVVPIAFVAVTLAAAAVLFVVLRPSSGPDALARVTRSDGPIEVARGTTAWQPGTVGSSLHLGDAVRTADGGAQLSIARDARIEMQKYTVLRFGGTGKTSKLQVELGSIELSGSGMYALDVGAIQLDGKVRIAANASKPSIELLTGSAQVAMLDGAPIDLVIGTPLDLVVGVAIVTATVDAGVIAMDAPAQPVIAGDIIIEVTGKRGEIQHPGGPWTPLPAGIGAVPAASRLRMGIGTSAALRMGAGELSFDYGNATITATGSVRITLPGGVLVLDGTPDTPAEATLVAISKQSSVAVRRGAGKLIGANGAELALVQGTTALVTRDGALRESVRVPGYFDLRVASGETFTIHDPRGETAVQFTFGSVCSSGGTVEVDQDARFRSPRTSGGRDGANVLLSAGSWAYRVRCHQRGGEGPPVANGRLIVRRDSGTRPLPKDPPLNTIDADGRSYRISYQSVIPRVRFRHRAGGGKEWKLHLATGGTEQTFTSNKHIVEVPGSKLAEQQYTYWFDVDGVKDPKVSTLLIDFVQTAPQVYIEAPVDGRPWGDTIDIRGAVLPGWTATIDTVPVPIHPSTRRFQAKVGKPTSSKALAIKLSHPQRGVHYYLRRP